MATSVFDHLSPVSLDLITADLLVMHSYPSFKSTFNYEIPGGRLHLILSCFLQRPSSTFSLNDSPPLFVQLSSFIRQLRFCFLSFSPRLLHSLSAAFLLIPLLASGHASGKLFSLAEPLLSLNHFLSVGRFFPSMPLFILFLSVFLLFASSFSAEEVRERRVSSPSSWVFL